MSQQKYSKQQLQEFQKRANDAYKKGFATAATVAGLRDKSVSNLYSHTVGYKQAKMNKLAHVRNIILGNNS